MQRYFIKIRAAVHYFVQQTLSFLQRAQKLSLPAFLSGGNVLKTVMARLMPRLGVLEQHPVQIDWHRFIGERLPILAESIENGDFGLN